MEIASKKRRVFAFLIDHAFFSFVAAMVGLLIASPTNTTTEIQLEGYHIVFFAALMVAYIGKDTIGGASIGKRVLGIGVRDYAVDQQIPGKIKLFFRNILIFIWPVDFIVMLIDPNNRRLGDYLTQTIVLKTGFVRKCTMCNKLGYDPQYQGQSSSDKSVRDEFEPMNVNIKGVCEQCASTEQSITSQGSGSAAPPAA